MKPRLLLLDEVTSALDPELVGEVLELDPRARRGRDDDGGRDARDGLRARPRRPRLLPRRGRDPRAGPARGRSSRRRRSRGRSSSWRGSSPPGGSRPQRTAALPRQRDLRKPARLVGVEPLRARDRAGEELPAARPRGAARAAAAGGVGTGSRNWASAIASAAGPLAISVAPAARTRAAASTTTSSDSSSVATAQTGKSGSSAATGPCARSVAVSGSAAIWQVSSSFSAISRAVANSGPRPITNIRPTDANGTAIDRGRPLEQRDLVAPAARRPSSSRPATSSHASGEHPGEECERGELCSSRSSSRRPRARRRRRAEARASAARASSDSALVRDRDRERALAGAPASRTRARPASAPTATARSPSSRAGRASRRSRRCRLIESRIAVRPGSSPNAYTPNDAALSDEPWPTMRTIPVPSLRAASATRCELGAVLEQAAERGRLLADLREVLRARCVTAQAATRASPATRTRSISSSSLRTMRSAGRADLDPAGVGADHARRDGGGRVERRLERDAERVQVPHRVDHGQHAAGEDAVAVAPDDAVAHLDRDVAEAVRAVAADARAGDCVGDEREAAAGRLPDHAHRVGGEVDAVEDDLDDHVGPGERRAGDARVAVGERAHRVEEVRDGAHAAVERRVRLLGARVGVAGRDGDPARDEQVDEVERPGQLGCQREEPDRPRREETLEQGRGPGRGARREDASRAAGARGRGLRRARRGSAGRCRPRRSRRARRRAAPRGR